ncbi:MAG: penicillin acylase family protein, partial [Microlunatus sp.]|nr:penicillin acylase family protein [Microlunatus sp.]
MRSRRKLTVKRVLALALAVPVALAVFVSPAAGDPVKGDESPDGSGSTLSSGSGSVTIKRDTWGTPHIYSKTTFGLFYGYGYAAAQDRLFQLDMTRRGAKGTVSEVLGSDYVDFDTSVRSDYDPASIRAQYAALPKPQRDVLDGYAAGVNAWLGKVTKKPDTLLPKQYLDFGFQPTKWTAIDVAMVTVGTMDIRFSDYSSELQNLAALQQLQVTYGQKKGMTLFNQIKYKVDPLAPATITGRSWPPRGSSAGLESPSKAPNGLVRGTSGVAAAQQVTKDRSVRQLPGATDDHEFSNMMLVGKKKASGAKALLLNGPQFGFVNPSYVYGVGLHGAGFDLVGNTPFAYPVVLFGHNQRIAWGATAGNGDTVDYYQEILNPADPLQYKYQGRYRDMEVRTETIEVKDGAARQIRVLSTVHGLVMATVEKQGVAYAKKRSWAGHELAVLFTWMDSTKAQNWKQWKTQAAALPISINLYYTDRRGNIGYFAAGHFPQRPDNQDRRLPASGIGNMEWQGIQPARTGNPHILNPKDGWLANWNNSPITNFPNSDFIPWGAADRVTLLQDRLRAAPSINSGQLWQIMRDASYADVNAGYFVPIIAEAAKGLPANSKAAKAAAALTRWDQTNNDLDRDGHYDSPGTAAMRTWIETMERIVLSDDLPPNVYAPYSTAGYPSTTPPSPGSQNIQQGTKLVYNALLGKRAGVPQTVDLLNGKNAQKVVRQGLTQTYDT